MGLYSCSIKGRYPLTFGNMVPLSEIPPSPPTPTGMSSWPIMYRMSYTWFTACPASVHAFALRVTARSEIKCSEVFFFSEAFHRTVGVCDSREPFGTALHRHRTVKLILFVCRFHSAGHRGTRRRCMQAL